MAKTYAESLYKTLSIIGPCLNLLYNMGNTEGEESASEIVCEAAHHREGTSVTSLGSVFFGFACV